MLFEEKHSKQNYDTFLHYRNMRTIPHCQTTAEILLITRGIVHAVCQHEVYRLTAGKAIWIMPYEIHSYDTIEENDTTVYIFSTDMLPDFFQFMDGKRLTRPVISFSKNELDMLSEKNNDLFSRKSALYALASKAVQAGTTAIEKRTDFDPMCKMMLYIQSHYRENVTLHDLARHMGYSYNYASHLFRQYFSTGFCEMINMHRLDEAARLLKHPPFSIAEIAGQTGFSTIRTFNTAFKKRFLMTPSEYALSPSSGSSVQSFFSGIQI